MANTKKPSDKSQNEVLPLCGVLKRFIFKGKLPRHPFEVEVEAEDRESAIAYIEVSYPAFKWYISQEIENA